MHILYVDESGIEDLSSGTSHFVLLGVAIPSEQWKSLDSALNVGWTPRTKTQTVTSLWTV